MATFAELASLYDIETTSEYEGCTMQPRTVTSVEPKESGALSIEWVDGDGVLKRHTTTQFNPPAVAVGDTVVGGWLDDGYKLVVLSKPAKKK